MTLPEFSVDDGSRTRRLKAATNALHQRLDAAMMAREPFATRARYGLFLDVQNAFHRDVDAFYADARLAALLPGLRGRRRLPAIERDLADLGLPVARTAPAADPASDVATALGWVYVAEGSNLGAAFLIKEARKLGLSEDFGARHLAAAPEGRGLSWRGFTEALDRIELDVGDEVRAVEGARAAFRRVQGLVDGIFGAAEPATPV
jgi:heme oxygenase